MTYAPADLLAVQRYAREKTGQDWASLGIVGDTSHNSSGGYHVGHDVLHALRTAPEDPGSDYSYVESQRDRNGLTDAASAFDLGGNFPRFREFNAWIVGRARAGDSRCRDIREIIYTPDGRTVRRWDALGVRSSGDSSHLTHTHFSFFRDSEGRRDKADNFLGLLQEFFNGGTGMAFMDDTDAANLAWRVEALVAGRGAVLGGNKKGEVVELVRTINTAAWRMDALMSGSETVRGGPTEGEEMAIVRKINDLAEKVDVLLARPAVALSADQVTALGADISAVLVAHPDTPLGEADIPAMTAALDQFFRTHFGQPAAPPV